MLAELRFSNFRVNFSNMHSKNTLFNLATFSILFVFIEIQAQAQTYINEFMASNQEAVYDDFFEFDDWVEIYHEGGVLNLEGYYLSDREDNLTKYEIPSTNAGITTITPGGHLVFWLDNDTEQGENHTNFKLSPDGEGIFLTEPDGITIVDSIVFPPQQTDISYGRECDGCEDWIYFDFHTQDDDNVFVSPETQILYINEVLIDNESNLVDEDFDLDPWFEIYNPNSFQVNLSSYTISNDVGQTFTLPSNMPYDLTIEAEGFLLFWLDGEPEEGGHHVGFVPSTEASNIILTGPDGEVTDDFEYETSSPNTSWGRQIDGGSSTQWFDIPTPRVSNTLFIIQPGPVVINELQSLNFLDTADYTGAYEDWFEIYNTGDHPVDIGGYYFTDRLNQPTKYKIPDDIPDSTTIAPGEFVLIWADEDNSEGWNHTNFKFNSDGEQLVFRSPDGFTIADSVHFIGIPIDYSWGRDPDGFGTWREFVIGETTPEDCNVCTTVLEGLNANLQSVFPNPTFIGGFFTLEQKSAIFDMQGRFKGEFGPGKVNSGKIGEGAFLIQSNNKVQILVIE